MLIGRDQILELLRSQGQHNQADRAAVELPGTIDTGNARLMAGYGIDAAARAAPAGPGGGARAS